MTFNQKKIAAFAVFFALFSLQVVFSISALHKLHVSHHVIEEEWEELNRVQALEDLLDAHSNSLLAFTNGQSANLLHVFSRQLPIIANLLEGLVEEYASHNPLHRTEHELVEDRYLVQIIDPLRGYVHDLTSEISRGKLGASQAKEYYRQLAQIRSQIVLLRQSDADFAAKALDQAKKARSETLRNSLVLSLVLAVILIVWGAYFLVNINRQTQLEIFQQKIMAAGLLAQSLAHEIRNPLGVIKSAAGLLAKRSTLDKESRELAGYMVEETARIDDLIKDLLSLSRKKSQTVEEVDIGQIIRSVLDLLSGKIKQAGLTVNFMHGARDIKCACVPGQIRQIVLNLLLNAIDSSSAQSSIEITTDKKDNWYIISVRDYGKGFPMKEKEKIFDLFYTTKESGFGIGLAVVKRIVDEHGGQINAQSWPGQGALFTVLLPLKA